MTKHELHLQEQPFKSIKSGHKKVEMRLFDEKRKLLKVNDEIIFENNKTGEKLETRVKFLKVFNNFEELYKNFDKIQLGYTENDEAKPEDMEKYYPKEKQRRYGVLAIGIELIKD